MPSTTKNRYPSRSLKVLATLLVGILAFSYFINPIVRERVETAMNRGLRGYHAKLAGAHLQVLNASPTLYGLTVMQNAHPEPPVAKVEELRLRIQWRELIQGHVVANVLVQGPAFRINVRQLQAQRAGKVSLREVGGQISLQRIYPFKINRLEIPDGDLV